VQSGVAPTPCGIARLQSVQAPTPHAVGVSATQAVAPPGRQVPAAHRQLLPAGSNPALHLNSQACVETLQMGVAFATPVVQVVQLAPHPAALSGTHEPAVPQATVPAAHTHFVPVGSGSKPALQVTPHVCVSGLQAAEPFPPMGAPQGVQLGPQATAVSSEQIAAPPQAFCPAGQAHPPAPSGTKVALQLSPQAPAVQLAVACAGAVHATQFGPQAAGVSVWQTPGEAQVFVPVGQTQFPRLSDWNPPLHCTPHTPAMQVAAPFGVPGQLTQFGPQVAGVSATHEALPPQVLLPVGQTQEFPLWTKPLAASQRKAQACCVASGFALSQKTFAFGTGSQTLHAGPQWLSSSA